LHCSVLCLSLDPIDQRKPPTDPGNITNPHTDSTSEPQGRELVYAAHVSLDRTAMEIDGKDVPLSPEMAVTVEIKTGAQRVITYLMSPLLRFKQEALHER
jgi:hemolysin D